MEKGLTSREYLEPSAGATKLSAALRTAEVLRSGGKVAVVLNAKKETAYGFADIMRAVESSRRKLGGETIYIANLDPKVGLPRIRKYAENINSDLLEAGVDIATITGGLDEYPVWVEKAANALDMNRVDLRIMRGGTSCRSKVDQGRHTGDGPAQAIEELYRQRFQDGPRWGVTTRAITMGTSQGYLPRSSGTH